MEEAYDFVRDLAANGQTILFVGTKKQATDSVKEEASRVGMYYVNARWLGGMLTNFKTMRTRVDRLAQLKKMQEDGTFDMLPKKEVIKLMGEMDKLEKYLGGVKEMKKLPGAMFVVDPRKEHNAIAEARKLHIPIVAIVDTNCDPDGALKSLTAGIMIPLCWAARTTAIPSGCCEPFSTAAVTRKRDVSPPGLRLEKQFL